MSAREQKELGKRKREKRLTKEKTRKITASKRKTRSDEK